MSAHRSSPGRRQTSSAGGSPATWVAMGLVLLLMFGLVGYVVDLRGLVVVLAVVFAVAVVAGAADKPDYRRRFARRRGTLRTSARQ